MLAGEHCVFCGHWVPNPCETRPQAEDCPLVPDDWGMPENAHTDGRGTRE